MKRTPITIVAVMLFAVVAGCTPDSGQQTPTPEPVMSTPTPTPTPQWTEEEQAAIDAVQNYLEVWTSISQNLQTADWNAIRDVSSDPAASEALSVWAQWNQNGWHLEGGPMFIPDYVNRGGLDALGQRYHVHGCFSITDGYLLDINGNRITDRGTERGTADYLVLKGSSQYLVLEDNPEDEPC